MVIAIAMIAVAAMIVVLVVVTVIAVMTGLHIALAHLSQAVAQLASGTGLREDGAIAEL